jgi:hypothetical protein
MFSISYTVSSLATAEQTAASGTSIARDPTSLPAPIGERAPTVVKVTLTARELDGALDPQSGTTYPALLSPDLISRHVPGFLHAHYFIAGPPAMVAGVSQSLSQAGIEEGDIRADEFFGY